MTTEKKPETEAGEKPETENKQPEKKPETEAGEKPEKKKPESNDEGDDEGDDAKAKAKLAEEKRIAREVEKRLEKRLKDELEKKQREADEAAEAAKKPELERLEDAKKKAETAKAAMEAELAETKRTLALSEELQDQDLKPASANARKHIAAAFKAAMDEGKDQAEALKAVFEAEPYLFKANQEPQVEGAEKKSEGEKKKVTPGKTAPSDKGPTAAERNGHANDSSKNKKEPPKPGDLDDPQEIAAAIRERHGFVLHIGQGRTASGGKK